MTLLAPNMAVLSLSMTRSRAPDYTTRRTTTVASPPAGP